MRIIDLALKDIRQVLRDKRSVLFLIIMPVVFTYIFGMMNNNQNKQADPRLVIAVVNHDTDGALSKAILDQLNASDTVRPELLTDEKAIANIDSRIIKGELAAGLTIPQGFSAGTLNGDNPQMETVINEETPNGQTARRALQTTLTRALGMAQTARASLSAYEAQNGKLDDSARSAYLQDAVSRAAQEWQSAPLAVKTSSKVVEQDPLSINPYNQYSPGMIVQFTIFGLTMAAMVMVTERRTGAMARLLTTPMTKVELIAGHTLGMFVVFFVQGMLLIVFGQMVLKVNYFREPAAVLLVLASLALWVASLGLLVSTLSKKEDQVVLFAMVGMFLFSALGGAWFSLGMVGKAFSTVGHLMPTAWAIEGFQNILIRGLGFGSVVLPVTIVLGFTVLFFGLAVWKFKYE